MLTYLTIRHFTIADFIELELLNGMTVITGETGAGKSLMIDALEFCLGARADTNAIRTGCTQFEIIAHFDISNHVNIQNWLDQHELASDKECLVRRIVKSDGRSLSSINGISVPLQMTRELSHFLVTIHGQHENQLLLKRETHREIIDAHASDSALLNKVRNLYHEWNTIFEKINALKQKEHSATHIEFLRFQLQELEHLQLNPGELEKIENEHKQLSHADSLITNCQQAIFLLKENESGAIRNQLHQTLQLLGTMQDLNPEIQSAHELLTTSLINAEEALASLQLAMKTFETNPARLNQIEKRLQAIDDIARKHRIKAYELPLQQKKLEEELRELSEGDQLLQDREQQLISIANDYFVEANLLTKAREKTARKLEKQLTDSIRQIGMPNASCFIQIEPIAKSEPQAHGMENLEIFIVTNPGATPLPLKKVASGGELSRISLSLQVIAATSLATPTLLFDEVDVGIGGATAAKVGQLLHQLGQKHQVICVTHHPQVASQGDHHFCVEKHVENNTTVSIVKTLTQAEKIEEIARMLGGHKITAQTRAHAEELLGC